MKKIFLLFFLVGVLLFSFALAGTTGKIVGKVTDATNGEPIPGVNVFIPGTTLGATSDLDGNYFILNVPPGEHTLRFEFIGYARQDITRVRVQIDLTTRIDARITPEVLTMEAVEIVAERPVVVRDISNSQLNINQKVIETMPITNVNQVLTLQAGIQSSSTGIVVRGGGANQTVFMIDGLSYNDERNNFPYAAVALSATEEYQVQTGGFNAEYGQARSGVVNVITKEGSPQRYSGSIFLSYRPAAPKHFGISIYDKNSYFNRPFYDPAVCWSGTSEGTWDAYTQRQYYNFEGWNAVADRTLQDDDPTNDLTPDAAQRIFDWYRRRQGDIKKADYVVDLGFGGPVPYAGNTLGNPRFFFSYYRLRDMFVYPLSHDSWEEFHTQLKLNFDMTPTMKLMVSGLYGEDQSVSPYDWTVTPTGTLLRSQEQVADLTNSSNRGISIPYMPGYYSPGIIYHYIGNVKLLHTLSSRSFYEVRLQYKLSQHNVYKTKDRNTSPVYEIVPGYFVDEAPYGYMGDMLTGIGGMHLGGWMNLGRDSTENATYTFRVDYTKKLNIKNDLKTGIELVYNDYNVRSATVSPALGSWNRTMIYRVYPFRIGAYVQDKLEYEDFIANLGLRLDYSSGNTKKYTLDPFDPFFSPELGAKLEEEAPFEDSKSTLDLSPRLGISHPITENSKLYFNYGHFRSEPFSSYRFRIQRDEGKKITYLGDPNLSKEKTVAYELGYEQGLFNTMLLKVAAYYKNVTKQPGWILYRGLKNVLYYKAENNNYADIRGFELTLSKHFGHWITGFFNYTYDVRTSGYFGLLQYNEDPQRQQEYLKNNPVMTRTHPQPYARLNLDFHTPSDFGPQWAGFLPMADWSFNLLADWVTGRYETFNPQNLPGIVDDVQWRDWHNVNLRIGKQLRYKRYEIQLYMDIINLFNTKYMSEAGFADAFDRRDYLESLRFPWETGEQKGTDRVGDYRPVGVEYDPLEPNPGNDPAIKARNDERIKNKSYIDMPNITSLTFLNPRSLSFGLRFSF